MGVEMDISTWLRGRILGLTVVSFGCGAAFAVAVHGVPSLWTAEAAGWASAIVTFGAVVVALVTAHRQLSHAQAAVLSERETAELVQQREWDIAARGRELSTMRLAFAFSRELSYARRLLASKLLDWDPRPFGVGASAAIHRFSDFKPLGELVLIQAYADRLDGFGDDDAFLLLTVLTTWQFFNGAPMEDAGVLVALRPETRVQIAKGRLAFGFELMEVMDRAINALANYYQENEAITGSVSQDPPEQALAALQALRDQI